MWTCSKPASSSAARIAATRPSIMSEGAITSAPARAWIHGLPRENGDGLVVEDFLAAHQPVMTVARIGIERDIGDDAEIRRRRLDGAAGAAHDIALVERLGAFRIAGGGIGVGEQRDGRNAEPLRLGRRLRGDIDGHSARHRAWRRRAARRPRHRPRKSARSGRRPTACSRAPGGAPSRSRRLRRGRCVRPRRATSRRVASKRGSCRPSRPGSSARERSDIRFVLRHPLSPRSILSGFSREWN